MINPVRAAVLVAVSDSPWRPRVLLLKRAVHLPLHPGEVGLPGGKALPGETGRWDTALRETWEEVGIPAAGVRRLGMLGSRTSKTGLEVAALVGLVRAGTHLRPDPGEVDHVFWVPLDRFLPPQRPREVVVVEPGLARHSLCYWYRNYRIWGLTARILHELALRVAATGSLRRAFAPVRHRR